MLDASGARDEAAYVVDQCERRTIDDDARRRRAAASAAAAAAAGGGLGGGGADIDGADVDGGADIDGGGAGIDGDGVAAFDAFDAARRDAPLSNPTLAATLLKFGRFFLEVRRPARALASLQRALERRAGYAVALGDVGAARRDCLRTRLGPEIVYGQKTLLL